MKINKFTGLYDKRHKQICLGDILQGNGHKYVVEWNVNEGEFNIVEYGIYLFEVIGNIYDNPNLID